MQPQTMPAIRRPPMPLFTINHFCIDAITPTIILWRSLVSVGQASMIFCKSVSIVADFDKLLATATSFPLFFVFSWGNEKLAGAYECPREWPFHLETAV